MTFILSENRKTPEHCAAAFRAYEAYLSSVKDLFPPSALRLATSSWYFTAHRRSPHDSWLESLSVHEASTGSRQELRHVQIRIRLLASHHDGFIELFYPKVFAYSFERTDRNSITPGTFHGDWLYDEFTLSSLNHMVHAIEWQSARWRIEADDIHYTWNDRTQSP